MNDSTQQPLGNDPAVRDSTGTLKEPAATTTAEPTPTTTPTNSPTPTTDTKSDSTNKPAGAPESYSFKAPEGQTLDAATIDAATPLFRELNLTNDQAQKLVDFYQTRAKAEADQINAAIATQGKKWSDEAMADPAIGPKIDQIKSDIGRAYDAIGNPKLVADFRAAMDQTMIGNNPAFIKLFHAFAARIIEGTHVAGGAPSPTGQSPDGKVAPTSAAARMYPHLVRNS